MITTTTTHHHTSVDNDFSAIRFVLADHELNFFAPQFKEQNKSWD
jgi:hypothetical protein